MNANLTHQGARSIAVHRQPLLIFVFALLVAVSCKDGFDPDASFNQTERQQNGNGEDDYLGHPRILLLRGEEEALKKNLSKDSYWMTVHRAMLNECTNIMKEELPSYRLDASGVRMHAMSCQTFRKIFTLAYAYRITKSPEYLGFAIQIMDRISDDNFFPDWHPVHFLDVAEMCMGLAIGYDWFYDMLRDEQRERYKAAIVEKGLKPSLNPQYNSNWLNSIGNWGQVCHAGMAYGALALLDETEEKELAEQILERAREKMERPMQSCYMPEGAYPEGPGYWQMGTTANVMYLSAMERYFGEEYIDDLLKIPGFMETGMYSQHVVTPTLQFFSYSDNSNELYLTPAAFWFYGKSNRQSELYYMQKFLLAHDTEGSYTRGAKNRHFPAIMVWGVGTGTVPVAPLANPSIPQNTFYINSDPGTAIPICVMRSSWDDPGAVYVGFKSGRAGYTHGHMDVGSFVMDAHGINWSMDLGSDNYGNLEVEIPGYFDMAQNSERWTKSYRTNPHSHSVFTFDDKLPSAAASAKFTNYSSNSSLMYAVTDLSAVYQGQVNSAKRGVALVDREYVMVEDLIATNANATVYRWKIITPGVPVFNHASKEIELSSLGEKMYMKIDAGALTSGVQLKEWSTAPPTTTQNQNIGTRSVGFEITLPANAQQRIKVWLMPGLKVASPVTNNLIQ